jgi:hypothetical protein
LIDYCDIETRQEDSQKNPWGLPPSLFKCSFDADVSEWYGTEVGDVDPADYALLDDDYVPIEVAFLSVPECELEKNTFRELVSQWKEETWFISSIKKRIAHPAYLKIIGLGRKVIPWLLEELEREPDYWYAALEATARPNPVPDAENVARLKEEWLAWGRLNGYL